MRFFRDRYALACAMGLALLSLSAAPARTAGGQQPSAAHFSTSAQVLYQLATQAEAPADADVVVVDDEESVRFDADGKCTRTVYVVYRVLNQKGVDGWSDVEMNWEPWAEERPDLRARVITPDGVELPLDQKTITDAPAKESQESVFSDRRVLRAPLPAIAPGSVVEEEATFRRTQTFPGAGLAERDYFGRPVPVERTVLELDAPTSLPLRYDLQLLPDLKPQRTESDGRVHIVFEAGASNALDDADSHLPSDLPEAPNVAYATGASWQAIAEEYSKIVDRQIAGAELTSVLSPLTAGKSTREEKAAAILQFVSGHIRYTGVEFEEASVVPRRPAETLSRAYGDCKDKAALLVALFRGANIPAYVALLNVGNTQDLPAKLPGMGWFDHAIVYVPGSPALWIDATDEYARLGELPAADQGRLALVARPESQEPELIPVSSSQENTVVERREFHLAENGAARIVETSLPQGTLESAYRRSYADKADKSTKDNLTDYIKGQYLGERLDRFDRSDPSDLNKPFEMVLECAKGKRGYTDLSSAVVAIRFDTLFNWLPSELRQREKEEDLKNEAQSGKKPKKKRTADYQLNEAFVTAWEYTIYPPPGFRPKPLPQNARRALGPALLVEEFKAENDGVVHATIRFDTVKRRMTVAEGTALRNAVADILDGEPIEIYFEPVGLALFSEGRVRESLKSYRDLIALHPNEAVHHLQLANVLLEAGIGEAARTEARTAVQLEPNSAMAQSTLAQILEYDVVGRKLRPGSDFAGAEAAFRTAEKLDPEDKTIPANLALLLEYNHWGLRYGPGAKLAEAVEEYRRLSAQELSRYGLQNNPSFALFYSGKFQEARQSAVSLNPQPVALIVACVTALEGSPTGLAEARKRTTSEDQFKQIVRSAGYMLANLRRYALSADLLEAGASGENASGTAADAVTYRKTRPREEIQFADDPAGLALRYFLAESDPDVTVETIRALCSHNGAEVLADPAIVELRAKEQRKTLSAKSRGGLFADIGLDTAITRAQPKVEGDDATGYRVTLWPSASYEAVIYVVKEMEKYKVLGKPSQPAALGLEVLDRVAAGNLAGARTLLDWEREEWHLAGGDDPLASGAFPRLWTRGRNGDATAMRVAAAALMTASLKTADRALAILEPAEAAATNEIDKVNLLIGRLAGYWRPKNYSKTLIVSSELAKMYPESNNMFYFERVCLLAMGKFQEARRLAEERLQRLPGDLEAERAQASIAEAEGDFAAARGVLIKLRDQGKATGTDLNNLAWDALFTGRVEGSDVEDALKATQLDQRLPSSLHTLGCVYAATGKTKAAREVLVQAMDALNLDEPDDNYWLAFGLIAEQYGEYQTARADYSRVHKPEFPRQNPNSSYQLAQIRLKALEGGKE